MPTAPRKTVAKKPPVKSPGVTRLLAEFELDRETPGTYRLNEIGERENQVSGAIYLKKGPLEGTKPTKIRVTIEVLSTKD